MGTYGTIRISKLSLLEASLGLSIARERRVATADRICAAQRTDRNPRAPRIGAAERKGSAFAFALCAVALHGRVGQHLRAARQCAVVRPTAFVCGPVAVAQYSRSRWPHSTHAATAALACSRRIGWPQCGLVTLFRPFHVRQCRHWPKTVITTTRLMRFALWCSVADGRALPL